MSYGTRYSIPFKNRANIDCEILLQSNDGYSGPVTTLEGSDKPFILRSQAQDNQIPYGIKATEAIIEFFTDGVIELTDLYNESDTFWRVIFNYNSSATWYGFLQLDNCFDIITDTTHVLQLNANDGLGRLQTLDFILNGVPIVTQWTLTLLLSYCLSGTGLFINTKAWLNIYENSTQDRTDHDYLTFLQETVVSTKYFINDDGTTKNRYEVLNQILTDFRCVLTQANGCWQIIRWGDVRLFSDGTMPGTLYNSAFSTYSLIAFPASIEIGLGLSNEPINENQQSRILRPYQYSKETFNYNQPALIDQYNLQLPQGATPFATHTTSGLLYSDYDIPTYFTTWRQTHGDTSYLEIVQDATTLAEQDRYILTPGATNQQRGIQFNPIPVTAGDNFDFTLQYRSISGGSNTLRFWIRFIIIIGNGTFYALANQPAVGSPVNVHWTGPFSTDSWDQNLGIFKETNNVDTQDWTGWSISEFVEQGGKLPLIPEDGVLLIEIRGTNGSNSSFRQDTEWKSVSIQMTQYINQSIQITGQTHNNSQAADIKNNLQRDIDYDDAPRNTITGTLFTNAQTNFNYTDINNGENTNIGDVYFTRTASWHRASISEARKLGDLNTYNDLFMQRIVRTIVEGDFYGLQGINLLSLIRFNWLSNKKFIFGTWSADYMSEIWNATLYEIFNTGEVDGDLTNTYVFNYIYNSTK